jgi:hypothetical protein
VQWRRCIDVFLDHAENNCFWNLEHGDEDGLQTAPSEYVLAALREGADFTLYRGRRRGDQSPVLVVALAAEQPSPQDLRRLEHEYSLATELNAAWAANPLELTRHEGRTVLILRTQAASPWIGFLNWSGG